MTTLLAAHEPDALVAFGQAGGRSARDLLRDAGRVAAVLPLASAGSQVLLVFQEDRYAMAVALLGAFAAGHAVALPPNTRREAVVHVRDLPDTVAVLHDTAAGIDFRMQRILEEESDAPALDAASLPDRRFVATVFTSGTTGGMSAFPKTADQLLLEAEMLGEVFGIGEGDRVVGTVSAGHIYGLLFTLLLPLVRGAAFSRETPLHAEAIARRVSTHVASVLVTVPVHLRALGAVDASGLDSLRRVFSSTGPLSAGVVTAFHERHEKEVTEILGSTETGGIGFRARPAEERFRPLEGVHVAVDVAGRLLVDSPYVDPDLPRPFVTADLGRLEDDGRFTHFGRVDGIVKVGGRRIAIREVEERLLRHPGVRDAAVAAVSTESGRGHQLLAAVVAPSCSIEELRAALLERFDPSALPRRFIEVEALPREKNGKLVRARLLRLFGLGPNDAPLNYRLGWGEPEATHDAEEEGLRFSVEVPEDYAWFDGHFPGYPILAGAVQLKELVFPAVEKAFPELRHPTSMSRIKFTGRIVPGDRVTVEVRRKRDRAVILFEVRKPDAVCARGHVVYAEGACT